MTAPCSVEFRPASTAWKSATPARAARSRGGVAEMKIDFGPGYRVYYTQRGALLVVLLCGGDKSTQNNDIQIALKMAQDLE